MKAQLMTDADPVPETVYQIPDTVDGAMFGVSFDGDDSGFRYAGGVEVTRRPEGMPVATPRAGRTGAVPLLRPLTRSLRNSPPA